MAGPRHPSPRLRPWHRLVEHYTPDGPLGRLLLAAAAGSVGGSALFVAAALTASTAAFWPVWALLGTAVGLAGVALALVVLWPVYLSLIGNVESASAYPEAGATARSAVGADDGEADTDDAVAVLKRRYAAGEVSEDEFERRLDDLLAVDAALDSRPGSRASAARDRETERN